MMPIRYLLFFVCAATFAVGCGSPYDGEILWKFETKKKHTQWAAVDEQRLYVCSDDVYCLERDTGRLLWEYKTFGVHSSAPVIVGGVLFFQSGGLCALDATTGAVLWEFWTKNWATVTPAVGDGRVYAPVGGRLFCLDADTGKRLWSVSVGPLEKSPVVSGNRLFYSSAETIFCLRTSSGKELWRFDAGSDRVQLASAGDYVLSAGSAGLVRTHRIETGQVKWQFDTRASFVDFCSLPAGRIIISAGALYCFSLETGELQWTFNQSDILVWESRILGNQLFVQSFPHNEIYRVAPDDGTLLGCLRLPDGGRLLTDPAGALFFSHGENRAISCLAVPTL